MGDHLKAFQYSTCKRIATADTRDYLENEVPLCCDSRMEAAAIATKDAWEVA